MEKAPATGESAPTPSTTPFRSVDGKRPDLLGPPHPAHRDVSRQAPADPRVSERLTRDIPRSEEHTSELQARFDVVCRHIRQKKNVYGCGSGLLLVEYHPGGAGP